MNNSVVLKTYVLMIILLAIVFAVLVLLAPQLISSPDWLDVSIGAALTLAVPVVSAMIGRRVYKLWQTEDKQ